MHASTCIRMVGHGMEVLTLLFLGTFVLFHICPSESRVYFSPKGLEFYAETSIRCLGIVKKANVGHTHCFRISSHY